jgi:hypothetical protein
MKIAVTPAVVERMLLKSKKIFKESTFFGEPLKEMAASLSIVIIFNDKLKVTAGRAMTLTAYELKTDYGYEVENKFQKSYDINDSHQYLVIEINRMFAKRRDPSDLFDTVSHEYAHCIDFMIRGNKNRKNSSYHDYFWQMLHKSAGGSGNPTY